MLMGKPAEKWLTERQHHIDSEKHFDKAITQSSRRASLRTLLMLQPDLSKTAQQSA
jgi:hypothetical protein